MLCLVNLTSDSEICETYVKESSMNALVMIIMNVMKQIKDEDLVIQSKLLVHKGIEKIENG